MKALLGWLGDPYLHVAGIGLVVLAIGAGMGAESSRAESSDRCEVCTRIHEDGLSCAQLTAPLRR